MMGSYSREINVQCIHESFPSEHAQSTDFIRCGKTYTPFNLLRILNFFSTKTTGLA